MVKSSKKAQILANPTAALQYCLLCVIIVSVSFCIMFLVPPSQGTLFSRTKIKIKWFYPKRWNALSLSIVMLQGMFLVEINPVVRNYHKPPWTWSYGLKIMNVPGMAFYIACFVNYKNEVMLLYGISFQSVAQIVGSPFHWDLDFLMPLCILRIHTW